MGYFVKLLLLCSTLIFASNFGEVKLKDANNNRAAVSADSQLYVTIGGETITVTNIPTDTVRVLVTNDTLDIRHDPSDTVRVRISSSDTIKIWDGTEVAEVDNTTGTLQFIDYAHHEIHGGSSYWTNISDDNIQSNPLRFKVVTPNTTTWAHMLVFGVSSGESTFTITEGPTGGATGGSAVTPTNRNRNSGNSSTMTITKGVTAPTGGTVLGGEPERHGFDKDKISGETRGSAEIVLKQNETYVFELESGTGDVVGNLLLDYYEHANR